MSRRLWWTLLFIAFLLFLYRVRAVLTPFLFAVLIAYVLYPLVAAVEQRGASRTIAILVVYACVALVLGVAMWLTLPSLLREVDEIARKLPRQAGQLEELGQDAVGFFQRIKLPATLRDVLDTTQARVQQVLESLAGKLIQSLMALFTNIAALLVSPVLAFYLLRDHQAMKEKFLRYIPAQHRGDAQYILGEINAALNGFFRGQLWICLFVGLFIYGGLVLLKVPYGLFIGLLAGLFDIIPYFGPVLGFLPAAALALSRSPVTVLWVLLLFAAANQIENSLISPWLIGDRVGLHPLAVIFAVLVGGQILGILGMLTAVPAAAMVRVVLDFFLLRRPQAG